MRVDLAGVLQHLHQFIVEDGTRAGLHHHSMLHHPERLYIENYFGEPYLPMKNRAPTTYLDTTTSLLWNGWGQSKQR